MNLASSTGVDAAVSQLSTSTPGTVAHSAGLLVLRKALDVQAASAAALMTALPPAPALATEGPLGRHLNTYA